MNDCVFCKIIAKEIPSYKIWENDDFYAFLSIQPHTAGHTLIIPKTHTDYFFDLENDLLEKILPNAKMIARAIEKAFVPKLKKVGVVVAGIEIAHAHLHLIAMNEIDDLDFSKAQPASAEALEESQKEILKQLAN